MNMDIEPVWVVNEATWDRMLRVLIGLLILAFVFVGPQSPWGFLGLVPLVTGVLGHCVVYDLLGISSRRRRDAASTRNPLSAGRAR
jgi:hypothetical protein